MHITVKAYKVSCANHIFQTLRFLLVTLVGYCNCKVLQYKQTVLILRKLYRYNKYHEINVMVDLS